jgi:hypothetical protein
MKNKKPVSFENQERLTGPTQEKKSTESNELSSAATKRSGRHIVDITDQFVGKSLIVAGASPKKNSLTPVEGG